MIIEMLFLCYVARLVYGENGENGNDNADNRFTGVATVENHSSPNGQGSGEDENKTTSTNSPRNNVTNINENPAIPGQNLQLNIRLASVTAWDIIKTSSFDKLLDPTSPLAPLVDSRFGEKN